MVKKYARIEDEETKSCSVFEGIETIENIKWCIETCKMSLLDVEKGYDGSYYIEGYAPQIPLEETKQLKLKELKDIRDKYKDDSGYNENIYQNLMFGIVENEEEKQKWIEFLKDLIKKYDTFKEKILKAKNIKELNKIIIDFK